VDETPHTGSASAESAGPAPGDEDRRGATADENTLLQRPPGSAGGTPARAASEQVPNTAPGAGPADLPDTNPGQAPEPGVTFDAGATPPGVQDSPEATPEPDGSRDGAPGFAERGRMRRRVRFLRKARELSYRDLGGLVFDLHRFDQRNDTLVLGKLDTIGRIDGELRTLENGLAERRPVTVLREAGIAACPRCAAIHGSDDRFCPNCGLAMDVNAERPVAGSAAPPSAYPGLPAAAQPLGAAPAPAQTAGPAAAQPKPSAQTPTETTAGSGDPGAAAPPAAPARSALTPAGPAPGIEDGDRSRAADRPGADQPTEIIRPPRQGT
jgi:hypothetical protein